MATKAELERSLNDPDMQNFLRLIASAEGVKYGYNTLFGNTAFGSLAQHPNKKVEFTEKDGTKNYTTAAGAYQFLSGTWATIKKKLGLKDFSGKSQDIGAAYLIAEQGALNDVLVGDFKTAINKLGGVWASLPSSKYKATQGYKSWDQLKGAGVTDSNPNSLKKYFMDLPIVKVLGSGILATNTIQNNEGGVLAGTGEALGNLTDEYVPEASGLVDAAGNFALRTVVIITAVALIVVGFYFMFKKELTSLVGVK